MRLWRRATGAVKDHSSIWRCTVSSSSYMKRKGDHLETMIVKATSHDESRMDYKNTQRLFSWIIASPDDVIKPLVCFLSMRLQKTRNWVVALKALMLFHGLLRCNNIPHIHNFGRLPFDLSTFTDAAHSSSCYNAFVRSYFDFLDHKSTTLSSSTTPATDQPIITHLLSFHNLLLSSLELLFQVRPQTSALRGGGRVIILEAMDCIVMEVIDVYTRICGCLKKLVSLLPAYSSSFNNEDLLMVLDALQQSKHQEEELHRFLQFYKDLGLVLNAASYFPNIDYVTQQEINQVRHLLVNSSNKPLGEEEEDHIHSSSTTTTTTQMEENHTLLTSTIITEKWEVFDDDLINATTIDDSLSTSQLSCLLVPSTTTTSTNVNVYKQHIIPDFITF